MTRSIVEPSTRPGPDTAPVVQAVTVIMGTVVGLTFLFGFGNVLDLALRLDVPAWVAPLVAPAVDLSILGLLLGRGTSPYTTPHQNNSGQPADCSPSPASPPSPSTSPTHSSPAPTAGPRSTPSYRLG
jgi:hypothetical protein